jgi:hypothetical protein
MPCEILKDMGIKFVYVSLKEEDSHIPVPCSSKSAFDVLMQMAKKYEYLPQKRYDISFVLATLI